MLPPSLRLCFPFRAPRKCFDWQISLRLVQSFPIEKRLEVVVPNAENAWRKFANRSRSWFRIFMCLDTKHTHNLHMQTFINLPSSRFINRRTNIPCSPFPLRIKWFSLSFRVQCSWNVVWISDLKLLFFIWAIKLKFACNAQIFNNFW